MMGKNIKAARERKKLSQKELGAMLGVGQSTVGMWEANRREPNVETLKRLSELLGTTVNFLIDETPYYVDDDAREMAELMHNDPNLRVLFKASRKIKKEDMETVLKVIKKFEEQV
jgi:transcriptional regulator with XRE-family HTH domain